MRPKGQANAEWHGANPMPKNPSRDERIRWHYEHADACGCRPVPEGLADDVRMMAMKGGRSA